MDATLECYTTVTKVNAVDNNMRFVHMTKKNIYIYTHTHTHKVKIKFTLEKATKAHRGRRDTALLFP
jgi:hypothetical protein